MLTAAGPGSDQASPVLAAEPAHGRMTRMTTNAAVRLWGGRFAGGPAEALARLSVSVQFDWRLAPYDLAASRAHARVLARAGLLDADELGRMLPALDDLEAACAAGTSGPQWRMKTCTPRWSGVCWSGWARLGGKLRAGRSRNDQVATDLRLYLRDHARGVAARLVELADALLEQAGRHLDTPAPGMTHLQHAQPVGFAHQLLAHVQPLLRDLDRLRDWDTRAAVCPARRRRARRLRRSRWTRWRSPRELGFTAPFANSIDAVADRDFVAEFLFVAALVGVHLSRLGEEVVLWTTPSSAGWSWTTPSPPARRSCRRRRTPDVAELARGKAGRLIGDLVTVLTMLKGLPLAYDRDLQEDKEPVFDAVDTLELVLPALAGMVATMAVRVDRLAAAAPVGFTLATEVADWLVRRRCRSGRPTRSPGAWWRCACPASATCDDVDDDDLAAVSPHLTPEVREVLSVQAALAARTTPGSTGPGPVADQLAAAADAVARWREWAGESVVPR